ncbi:MAG: acyltransferase [Hyphomonadaceae bacterium]
MKTLLSLQYLRALAALSVVLFHAFERRDLGGFDVGQMGVDVFFVLSGLVMWLISDRTDRSPAQFLVERIARVAPIYWLATIAVLVLWAVGIRQGLDHPDLWHTVKSFLFIPVEYPGKDKIYPLLIPGWTLNYEMFFYAIFALSLVGGRRVRLALTTVSIVGLVAVGAVLKPTDAVLATYTSPIMLEFLAGIWIGVVWTEVKGADGLSSAVMSIAGLLLIPALAWAWPDGPRIVVFGIPALLIVAGAALYERRHPVVKLRWFLLLGDASYSIYLWHFPSNSIWDAIAQAAHMPTWLAICFISVGGVVTGVAAYLLVERPIRNWIRMRTRRKTASVVIAESA